jgi:hypothetical protein
VTQTRSLTARQTAWYQLVSAAGAFIDHFHGHITRQALADVMLLQECAERVIRLEQASLPPGAVPSLPSQSKRKPGE